MSDSYIRTPFLKQRRGSFVLVLPTGRKLTFADSIHRGNATEALSRGRFANVGVMVEFALRLPRGFVTFVGESSDLPLTSRAGSEMTYDT